MKNSRPTTFDRVPRQTLSIGCASLRLDLDWLYGEYRSDFLRRTIEAISETRQPVKVTELLPLHHLHTDTLNLNEWIGQIEPAPVRMNWTVGDMTQLAELAADLADDQGRWADQLDKCPELANEANEELRQRLITFRNTVLEKHGSQAAEEALAEIHRMFANERDALDDQSRRWTARYSEELRDFARRLKAMARPRSTLHRWIQRVYPNLSPKRWLTQAQQGLVNTRIVPAIHRAGEMRIHDAVLHTRAECFERIVGQHDKPGLIDETALPLRRIHQHMKLLIQAISAQNTHLSHASNEIMLVDHLEMRLDPRHERRFVDLLDQQVQHGGCTPQDLAKRLLDKGVTLGTSTYLPHRWPEVPVAELLEALLYAVNDYLGYKGSDVENDLEHPQTATEHVATITFDHPELQYRTQKMMAELVRRSTPYAQFEPITGADPVHPSFLFCHPAKRKFFEGLLLAKCGLANKSNDKNAKSIINYQLRSPYLVTLAQCYLAAPGGAQRDYQQATRFAHSVRRDGEIAPLFRDSDRFPMDRFVGRQPNDRQDLVNLFTAACEADIVVEMGIGTGRFQLAKPEPKIEHLFIEFDWVPHPRPAEFFRDQIASRPFINYVSRHFPNISDWRTQAGALAKQTDPMTIAKELVVLGILKTEPGGLYAITVSAKGDADRLPPGLYAKDNIRTRGLDSDEFVAKITTNGLLYNTLFWQVADAYDLGYLDQTKAPDFVIDFLNQLG